MRLASIIVDGETEGAVLGPDGPVPLRAVADATGAPLPVTLAELVASGGVEALRAQPVPDAAVPGARFAAPWPRPGKIWGIGLNYRAHAADLDEQVPDQPGSFMKPATAVIGPGDEIRLPPDSQRVTAEAELGVVIGKRCRHVDVARAHEFVLGFTCIIDMTAEDILRRNPRYLTWSKSYDTFFSFGPAVVTSDEIDGLAALSIRTVVNGEVRAENLVGNMTFGPYELVAFHSRVMTLEPGDIISTGTPGASPIRPGDVVRCEIDGFPTLENPVVADEVVADDVA